MSRYLSNIAARSTGNDSNELLPSGPVFSAPNTGIAHDFTEENDIQNQLTQQNVNPAPPITAQKIQQTDDSGKTETGVEQKNIETSYFSKHIERVTYKAEEWPVKNLPSQTVGFNMEQASPTTVAAHAESKRNVNEPVSKAVPEKKGTKKHGAGKANEKPLEINADEVVHTDEVISDQKLITKSAQHINKLLPDNLRIERIMPDQVNNRSVQNKKMNEAVPKLVIGKITVEILPPKLPAAQKIITRVVQSPSKDSHSKSNKLIFGLGQM